MSDFNTKNQNTAEPPIHPLDEMYYLRGEWDNIGPISGSKIKEMIEKGAADKATSVNKLSDPRWIDLGDMAPFSKYFGTLNANISGKYAGFWIRVAALLLDYLILFIGNIVIALLIFLPFGSSKTNMNDLQIINSVSDFIFLISYFGYFIGSKWQATPGKRICGIYIVRENGKPVSPTLCIGRYFAYFLSSIILGFGFLMVAWTDQKKALHDIVCGTRVVYGKL